MFRQSKTAAAGLAAAPLTAAPATRASAHIARAEDRPDPAGAASRAAGATPWIRKVALVMLGALALGCVLVAAAGVSIGLHGNPTPPPGMAAAAEPPPGCHAEPGSDVAPFFCAANPADLAQPWS